MRFRVFGGHAGRRPKVAFVSLAALAAVAAGCGDSDSSGSGGGVTGGDASDSEVAAGVKAAEEATAENVKEPTSIPLTEPLKEKPPTGETFAYMKCDQVHCDQQAEALKEATAALGWNYKEIPFESADPATLVSAMKQALDFDPVAVSSSGSPRAVWEAAVPEYEAAGVYIVPSAAGPMEYDDTVIGGAWADQSDAGAMVANWIIADSGGEAHVVAETVSGFGLLKTTMDGFTGAMEENCPKCSVTVVDNTIAQVVAAQTVDTVVAAVQKDPKVNYVYTASGSLTAGIVPALAAAGLTDRVKITSSSGDQNIQQNVKSGTEAVTTAAAVDYMEWLTIDLTLRKMQGMDFDPEPAMPGWLLTKDVDFNVNINQDIPADWRDQMKELWLVG